MNVILSNQLMKTCLTSPAILFTLFCLLAFAMCKTIGISSENMIYYSAPL